MCADESFLILGGDKRFNYTADFLKNAGFKVETAESVKDLFEKLKLARRVVLPLPLSRDGVNLNAPQTDEKISLAEIFSLIPKNAKVFAGMITDSSYRLLNEYGLEYYDYYKSEELLYENAVITAEGIIQIISEELPVTINGAHFCVSGFGRVGKLTAAKLKLLGGEVTVAARKASGRLQAQSLGCAAVTFEELGKPAGNFDCIINTVPAIVITDDVLSKLKKDCLLIETASKPGGFSKSAEKKAGYINTGSLPGKTAPESAGRIIGKVILELSEGE